MHQSQGHCMPACAWLGGAGLDLLQAGRHGAAAELLATSVCVGLERLQLLLECEEGVQAADLAQLVKRAKAHLAALEGQSDHSGAMGAALKYLLQLQGVSAGVCWGASCSKGCHGSSHRYTQGRRTGTQGLSTARHRASLLTGCSTPIRQSHVMGRMTGVAVHA